MTNKLKSDLKLNSSILIQHNHDNIDINEAMIMQHNIDDGYTFPIGEQAMYPKDYKDFKEKLHKKYNTSIFDFTKGRDRFEIIYCPEFRITTVGDNKMLYTNILAKSEKISHDVFQFLKHYESIDDDIEVFLTSFYMDGSQINSSVKSYTIKDYEHVNSKYYPYIDTDIMFEQFLTNKENILILCGKPGTGKTSLSTQLLKYTLLNPSKMPYKKDDHLYLNVAYVKNTEVLCDDGFWRSLSAKEFDLVILDDLDYFLTSRSQEIQSQDDINRNKFINQFLSFTDGVEQNNTKFIITTNQPFSDIDNALLRKGRLFDILELRDLKNKEAKEIWESELSEKFTYEGNVLQADLGSDIQKKLNNKMTQKAYLKEKEISKINKTSKKVGF